ncbi:hypothetical protein NW759_013706 [Fusarium solani]|uniref:G domain-containing protein n=1 Tax=Fusarium solani TaxID=169388 RepID=A0A9P9KHS3_FUSSL|nr:uncharacterized protein B0J15DRAFT_424767 [Fusarium solani]KAH7253079.1 hypothetical protein B0J15DRAFT_424767 [Fusarium solani]KAJ4208269.1 hypothetical protein NW759_013706 [Fusarium solani]
MDSYAYYGHRASPVNLNAPNDDYSQDVDTSKIVVDAPTFTNLPESCDKFRILVIGKAGVGKSTICSTVFGVPPEKTGVSHRTVGTKKEKVWHPITFPGENENLVLHDSGGFEAGDLKCVDEIHKFIKHRREQPNLADQLHCIWYCISCRSNRPIESAEKEFFLNADVGDIPVVVVFTQFDTLVDDHFCQLRRRQRNRGKAVDMDQLERDAMNAAIADYDSNYRGQFEREFGRRLRVAIIRLSMPQPDDGEPMETSGVDSLVKETRGMLLEDGLKLLWTAAQCHSADMKLKESIKLGMDVFWKAVGTSSIPFIPFVGATAIYSAFIKILKTINTIWGIPSCTPLLHDSKVRNLFLQGCFDASAGDILGSKFLMALNFFGPLTAAQTATIILKMIAGITLIYEKLFWYIKNHPDRVVSPATIGRMVTEFRRSQGQRNMSARLTFRIHLGNCYDKRACLAELEEAVEAGRSAMGKEGMRKKTIVDK